jgi:thioredoxin-like negative regulator of GroEL
LIGGQAQAFEFFDQRAAARAAAELSAAFGIRSIPTLLFIPAKGTPQVAQGALPEEALRKTIDEFLLGKK